MWSWSVPEIIIMAVVGAGIVFLTWFVYRERKKHPDSAGCGHLCSGCPNPGISDSERKD